MASSLFVILLLMYSSLHQSVNGAQTYFADWSALAQDHQPTCVPIPSNMSLCKDIGYNKMRLPNLLAHDTIQEASEQSKSWVPLINVKCADDSKLFLCSLFAPVCLERAIYPCRSLCLKVKAGCESMMERNGYPWPSMLDCDKFPLDNDMCITSQAESMQGRKKGQEAKKNSASKTTKAGECSIEVLFLMDFYVPHITMLG